MRSAVPGVSPGRGLLIPLGYLHPAKCEHSEVQSRRWTVDVGWFSSLCACATKRRGWTGIYHARDWQKTISIVDITSEINCHFKQFFQSNSGQILISCSIGKKFILLNNRTKNALVSLQ